MRLEGFGHAWRGAPPNLTLFLCQPFVVGKAPGSRSLGPWHCSSVHPAQQSHHPKWYLCLSSSPTPWGSPVGSVWCRGGGCSLGTLLDDTPLYPNVSFDRWWCPSCLNPWRWADWFSCGLWAPSSIGHNADTWSPQINCTLMTLRRKLTLNFHHSQTHSPVKVSGLDQPKSCCHWLWSCLHCDVWSHSWWNTQWVHFSTSQHSSVLWCCSSHGSLSWLQKLNDGDAGGCKGGCPGPLPSMCHLLMAWVISCQSSHNLTLLTLSWACLLTQIMAPDIWPFSGVRVWPPSEW